jgi:hypothetical protein
MEKSFALWVMALLEIGCGLLSSKQVAALEAYHDKLNPALWHLVQISSLKPSLSYFLALSIFARNEPSPSRKLLRLVSQPVFTAICSSVSFQNSTSAN